MVTTIRRNMLPDIDALRRLSQSLAMLDAIISPQWEFRYYSFNSTWGSGEMMASMRNGSGDDYFLLFNAAGAILKGFAHESPMTPSACGGGMPTRIGKLEKSNIRAMIWIPTAPTPYWRFWMVKRRHTRNLLKVTMSDRSISPALRRFISIDR
jgi:hypothetical protein